jgi:hypothetical protein
VYSTVSSTIKGGYAGRDINDIWLTAQDVQAKFPTVETGLIQDNLAFTLIATQSKNGQFNAKFCAKNFSY